MPLQFKPPADPLTSLTSTRPDDRFGYETKPDAVSHVIESDALQRLTKEIERYGRRELSGRSILIAGHRGVGKTTLVRKAIENVRGSSTRFGGRPLFVDLHGPDLLAPPDKEPAGKPGDAKPGETAKNGKAVNTAAQGDNEPEAGAGDPSAEVKKDTKQTGAEASNSGNNSQAKQPSGADLQSFVERLTFSLYRAAAKEFVESFRALSDDGQYAELATQFALELDGSTDLGRIRLLYERVGAFVDGVLRTPGGSSGSQELALLAASSQAYRIISGKLGEERSAETSGTNTVNWSIAADNLLSPVTGLLTGALAWAALPEFSPLAKLFTSFTAGLASAIAVKFTRTVQREAKESSKVTFVPERDKLALRRLLPVLVDRFCDVGLPPIFVVDELDKVPDISKRMEGLMGFLKQFVTERAFFCFLVDRDYYEALEATVSTRAFPKEATLFGDRLFVQYAPDYFHAYLKNTTEVGTLAVGESQYDAARDLEVLNYVLLRRSYMHPFDLRREISRCTNAKNEFRFPPRALFNVQQYRNEVYYQVAVECVLAGEKLLDFAEDPNRAQLLYDALYFPIRTKKPSEEFDGSRKSLEDHLVGRVGKENGKLLSDEDLNIVHDALSELVKFLCTPRELLDTMQALAAPHRPLPKVFPQAAVGVIEAAVGAKLVEAAGSPAEGTSQSPEAAVVGTGQSGPTNGPTPPPSTPASPPQPQIALAKAAPLLEEGTERGKYRWRFDKYGYTLAPEIPVGRSDTLQTKVGEPKAVIASVGPDTLVASLLGDFEEAANLLARRHGTAIDIELWERMRLIQTPPTWSYLREAVDALRNPASLPATKVDEYNKALIEYQANLGSARKAIWSAVAIAATMAVHDTSTSGERRSLEILAEVLAETSSRDQMLKQLDAIAQEVTRDSSLSADDVQANASYRNMLAGIDASAEAVRGRPPMAASLVEPNSETFYENWFVQFYEGRHPTIDSLWPFLSLVMQSLPLGLQYVNPLRMTIWDWAKASLGPPSPRRVLGLERLGFRRLAAKEAESAFSKPEDSLRRAIENSIRKRGYEQASVILQPLPDTLTRGWFPSEKIACRIASSARDLLGSNPPDLTEVKYVLLEVDVLRDSDVQKTVDNIIQDFAKLTAVPKTAFFGSGIPTAAMPRGYPYVPDPRSLDDLVEILDAKPASDWASSAGPLA